jgi:hypothetical protein
MKFHRLVTVAAFALALIMSFGGPAAAQGKSSDLLTNDQVKNLTANAKTPADHVKLSKHYLALAAKYDAESAAHAAMATIERTQPTPAETKRPGSPGTALHCDRLSDSLRMAASEARAIAADHEQMAKSMK